MAAAQRPAALDGLLALWVRETLQQNNATDNH
jgi:hypothetical protein